MADEQSTAGAGDPDRILLRVCNSENQEMSFHIKRSTRLGKLFTKYCIEMGLDPTQIRFMYDGNFLGEQDTPDTRGMENNDKIDVYQTQTGGC